MDVEKAIAYLKGDSSETDPRRIIEVDEEDEPVLRSFCEGLHIAYLVDSGAYFEYVQQRHLSESGLSMDDLHGAALRNLSLLVRDALRVESHGEVLTARVDGNFESSLMLLDALWDRSLKDHLGESPIVAVPSRDVIGFCPGESAGGIERLRAVVEAIWPDGDHLVSRCLYRRIEGVWTRLGP